MTGTQTKVICFISSKGGSGKTVISSSLGTFLSELGFRVLMVDTDAATNGMTLLYLEQLLGPRRQEIGSKLSHVGLFEADAERSPTYVEISEKLHFVPAAFSMRETEDVDLRVFEISLRSVLAGDQEFAFVLLDAQAGTDSFARVAASTADQCVIVSEYDPVSAQGIERLKVLFAGVLNPSSTWVLFNKVLPEFVTAIGEGLSIARYLTPIPWDADVVRAFARRDLAINMQSPNPYTLAISKVAYNLFRDETGVAIEKWRGEAINTTTDPMKLRVSELTIAENTINKAKFRKILFRTALLSSALFTTLTLTLLTRDPAIAPAILEAMSKIRYDFSSLYIAALFFVATLLTTFFLFFLLNSLHSDKEEGLSLELISKEKAKLTIALDAANAALKFSSAGIYERGRRVRSLDKDTRPNKKVP